MRKIQEVLRPHFEQTLGQRQIARSANVSQGTVHEYLTGMNAAAKEIVPERFTSRGA
jgi:DNA-binding transcriptional regulator LsrR (DeoR family)